MNASDGPATMTFGQVIRQRRLELGLTQEALAERVGDNVRQADISRLERDYITMPRRSRLEALAQALDVSAGYLLMQSGWFQGEDDPADFGLDEETGISGESVAVHAVRELHVSGRTPAEDVWFGEHTTASRTLHEAIVRARELSSQTRTVLTESANTVRRAGQTRRRA